MTATSVVPPPMSTMRLPDGSLTGRPAPIAAAMGSSMRRAQRAPALSAASRTARFSTSVTPDGMPSSIRGRGMSPIRSWTRFTKYLIICSVTSKSLMTPSRSGRTAMMFAGVRPTIRLASAPMARTRLVLASIATTDGSLITIPRSRTWTSVLAVPRSMPMSREKRPSRRSNMVGEGPRRAGGGSSRRSVGPGCVAVWHRGWSRVGGRELRPAQSTRGFPATGAAVRCPPGRRRTRQRSPTRLPIHPSDRRTERAIP